MARPEPVPYRVRNLRKYRGDATKVIARSSWEKKAFKWFDDHPSVVEWSSEEVIVPYMSPLDDRPHRYFPDIRVTFEVGGKRQTYLCEIKPYAETEPPIPSQGKKRKTLLEQIATYKVNQAKWDACTKYCEERGWKFIILTEYELGIKTR